MHLPISNKQSNWTYSVCEFLSHKAGPELMKILPKRVARGIFEWAYFKEEAIRSEVISGGSYPRRTWFGLTGIDQYDLIADFSVRSQYAGER